MTTDLNFPDLRRVSTTFPSDKEEASFTALPWQTVMLYPRSRICCGSSTDKACVSNSILCVSFPILRMRQGDIVCANLSSRKRLFITIWLDMLTARINSASSLATCLLSTTAKSVGMRDERCWKRFFSLSTVCCTTGQRAIRHFTCQVERVEP